MKKKVYSRVLSSLKKTKNSYWIKTHKNELSRLNLFLKEVDSCKSKDALPLVLIKHIQNIIFKNQSLKEEFILFSRFSLENKKLYYNELRKSLGYTKKARKYSFESLDGLLKRVCGRNDLYLSFLSSVLFSYLREDFESYGNSLKVEDKLRELTFKVLKYDGDSRVKVSFVSGLARFLLHYKIDFDAHAYKSIKDEFFKPESGPYLKEAVLRIVAVVKRDDFYSLISGILNFKRTQNSDGIYVASTISSIAIECFEKAELNILGELVCFDSAIVKQSALRALSSLKELELLNLEELSKVIDLTLRILNEDHERAVKTSALISIFNFIDVKYKELIDQSELFESICNFIASSKDSKISKVFCYLISKKAKSNINTIPEISRVIELLRDKKSLTEDKQEYRLVSDCLELLEVLNVPSLRSSFELLTKRVEQVKFGKSFKVKSKDLAGLSIDSVCRVLSCIGRSSFGFDVKISKYRSDENFSLKIRNGWRSKRRLWRFFHEVLNLSPDKRQGISHLKARKYDGDIRIPSSIMCEITEARVPGEAVMSSREKTYEPCVPLVEDLLCSISKINGITIYSCFGKTLVKQKHGSFSIKRLLSLLKLNLNFGYYSQLRNSSVESGSFTKYFETLNNLGFVIDFQSFSGVSSETIHSTPLQLQSKISQVQKAVGSSFALFVAFYSWPFIIPQVDRIQLSIFIFVLLTLFICFHIYEVAKIKILRESFPLVIGGWGSRGKSGTERLKAALFSGLGYSIVSKTTGCEAMMVLGDPCGSLHEVSLFRAYDKATIWEQRDVIKFASAYKPHIVLWECMALNPLYVKILQKFWMKDDIATITNTYPDHEDIQGPSGINVAKTIAEFIPEDSFCITSEEQMTPLLVEKANSNRTKVETTDWLDASLIPDEAMARFPYLEHRNNIALVIRLAERMGISREFALREMADNVVLDLGVLRTSPVAKIGSYSLQFTNGMSANERAGCLNNWRTTGFDSPRLNEFRVVLVNNRADRVARSKVFSKILANDLIAEKYLFIGTNIQGILGMLKKELALRLKNEKLWNLTSKATAEDRVMEFEQLCKSFGLITLESELQQRAKQFELDGVESNLISLTNSEEISKNKYLDNLQANYSEYCILRDKLTTSFGSNIKGEIISFITKNFESRIEVIWDKEASPDQLARKIISMVPPIINNKILGVQNIKGTGLGFVYSWQVFEKINKLINYVGSNFNNSRKIHLVLSEIISCGNIPFLAYSELEQFLENLDPANKVYGDEYQRLKVAVSGDESSDTKDNQGLFFKSLFAQLFDIPASIYRKLKSRHIYRQLLAGVTSYEEAKQELWRLTKQQ